MDVGYLEMILYYLLLVLTIAQISLFFWINATVFVIYFDTLWF